MAYQTRDARQAVFAKCWGLNFLQLRWAPRDKASSVGPNHGAVVTLLVTPPRFCNVPRPPSSSGITNPSVANAQDMFARRPAQL